MESVYSKAFDHLSSNRVQVSQDACNGQKPLDSPVPVARSSIGRQPVRKHGQAATIRLDTGADNDNMGQGQTTPEYIDILDSEPRRLSQKHKEEWERARQSTKEEVVLRHDDALRRGHRNEESTDYCYAYSGSVSRDGVDEVDAGEPMQVTEIKSSTDHSHDSDSFAVEAAKLRADIKASVGAGRGQTGQIVADKIHNHPVEFQRSVSLKDDYSQPPDRLSISEHESHGDYAEPYRTNMNRKDPKKLVHSALLPDPGGIYEFAKDINAVPRPNIAARSRSASSCLKPETQVSYNHLNTATNKLKEANLADSNQSAAAYDHLWSAKRSGNSPVSPGANSKTERINSPKTSSSSADEVFASPTHKSPTHKSITPNYEEPWDSEEGQDRFTRLMEKAEKTDERRQSVDKFSGAKPQQTTRVPVDNSVKRNDQNILGKSSTPKTVKEIPAYEDAWDLPEKQKEFEEKLEKARKTRTSQGQIAPDDLSQGKVAPVSSSISDGRNVQEVERRTHDLPRYDSVLSMGMFAEKVDTSIPLEDQNFYHGTIKRSEAERMLCVFRDGSYLVRKSETSRNDYSLTLRGLNGLPMHLKITRTPEGKYVLGENSPPFDAIPDMVQYYTCHKLPIQNADKICLLYPIPC